MEKPISSTQNKRVKSALRLRDRRGREAQGRIIIDGARETLRAITAGVELMELFVQEQIVLGTESTEVWDRALEAGVSVIPVTSRVFAKLSYGDRVDEVVAVARTPDIPLGQLRIPANSLVAVIEGVEKPGNIGAIVRTADATGVAAVIVANSLTDAYNPNAIRSSLGTIFSLPVVTASSDDTRSWLAEKGFAVLAARVEGDVSFWEATYHGPTAIVLGSESHGLSRIWQGDDVMAVALPMLGVADSINVSVAAGVLFYEAIRQRGHSSPMSSTKDNHPAR